MNLRIIKFKKNSFVKMQERVTIFVLLRKIEACKKKT